MSLQTEAVCHGSRAHASCGTEVWALDVVLGGKQVYHWILPLVEYQLVDGFQQ